MISTQESPPDAAKKQRSRVSFDIAKDDEVIDVKQKNVNDDDEAGAASSDPDVSDDSTSKVQNDARSQQQFVMPSPRYNDIGFH